MANRSELSNLMKQELPKLGHQKRLCFRTNKAEVIALYKLINSTIFDNSLDMPIIEVVPRCRQYWGICFGSYYAIPYRRSRCKIRMMDKWYSIQWLITTLAHEMCHQYQWDIIGKQRELEGKERIMSHGPSFYEFRDKLALHGISLKRHHRSRKWFKHQNLFKS